MPRCFRLKTLFAALVVAGLVAGCDSDYDATADLQTEEDNRQQLTDAETRSSDDSVAHDAANPAFDYSANNRNGGNATNYDNERSIQIDQAGTEETVYFPADLATLTHDEES